MKKKYDYDWKALIEEQQVSGMNMKAYCRHKEIPYQAFKNHKYALQDKSAVKDFVPVSLKMKDELVFTLNDNKIVLDSCIDDFSLSRILKALTS